jgi:hypothetical protein
MKRILLLAIGILCVGTLAIAADKGKAETDGRGVTIQGAAPNGLLSEILTVASKTISKVLYWEVYNPATDGCKWRTMPTAAKGAYPQFTIPVATAKGYIVNKATPFVNFSGCTNGQLLQQ